MIAVRFNFSFIVFYFIPFSFFFFLSGNRFRDRRVGNEKGDWIASRIEMQHRRAKNVLLSWLYFGQWLHSLSFSLFIYLFLSGEIYSSFGKKSNFEFQIPNFFAYLDLHFRPFLYLENISFPVSNNKKRKEKLKNPQVGKFEFEVCPCLSFLLSLYISTYIFPIPSSASFLPQCKSTFVFIPNFLFSLLDFPQTFCYYFFIPFN